MDFKNEHIPLSQTKLKNGITIDLCSYERSDDTIWYYVSCELRGQQFEYDDIWVYSDAVDHYIERIKEFKDYTQKQIAENIYIDED